MIQEAQHQEPVCSRDVSRDLLYKQTYCLLQAFDEICTANGIDYFLVGDTLVGAVIYQDLIPGKENNPVIGMPREDYEKICDVIRSDKSLSVQSEDSFQASLVFAGEANPSSVLHIQVFDWMPADYDLRKFHVARITVWRKLLGGALHTVAAHRISRIAKYYNKGNSEEIVYLSTGERAYIPKEAITHLQRLSVGPVKMNAPGNTNSWIEQDREEEARRVKLVQADCLTIMKEIDRVCRAHDIGYFMCAGTLLGSLRYGGYIPWDDDIDVAMLRADYDRFLAIAPGALADGFFLQAPETDPQIPYLYAKVRMDETEYVTSYTQYRDAHQGISIDIFPFDLAPANEQELATYNSKTKELYARHRDIARRKAVAFPKRREQLRPFERIGRAVMGLRRGQYESISLDQARKDYEKHVTQFNNGIAAFNQIQRPQGYNHLVYNLINYINIETEDLLPLQEMPFENLNLYAPNNPDAFMKEWFGDDYMQEPPVHEQRSHAVVRWKAVSKQ